MTHKILRDGEPILSETSGEYAGHRPRKIFGSLDCKSGMRMFAENRVFFDSLESAVQEGYRPCQKCRPMSEEDFDAVKDIVPVATLDEFYKL